VRSNYVAFFVRWPRRYSEYIFWALHASGTHRRGDRVFIDISLFIHWHWYYFHLLILFIPLISLKGNFLVLPFTLWVGRRPTFLASNVLLLIATIGAAANNSYEGHLTARVFQGIATGATESVSSLKSFHEKDKH
jgi:MFS family permease